ncbi:glutathione S-transferase family protein [Phenylobacterium sp.]|uniref:glutathione S-transferase family protein n=1 Tax=Phenylobacterium sp. TaxID=1871053 RepID=UPI002730005E|nr:glutathione S-transferase family protein [Phenylobacterium sp.]MDP2215396.1 glutathione S-transferase family protein [Phenylobacterium sp.]
MITLYGFGPAFGLPDPSPYVMKTETQLKMAGLGYLKVDGDLEKAPKGKLPYLDDGGLMVADSTFIRQHIEEAYGIDFDEGLSPEQRAVAWAAERMIEDHLGWALGYCRWLIPENFAIGPAHFFDDIPEPGREQVRQEVLGEVRHAMTAQGVARHSLAEITALADRSLRALSVLLGDKPYLMGERPAGVDATALSFLAGLYCPVFASPVRDAALAYPNLVAYAERLMRLFFPQHTPQAMDAA